MKTYDSPITEIRPPMAKGRLDRLSVVLGFIAVAISAGSAIAIGKFGALILLIIPLAIFLIFVFVKPDYGLTIFILITYTQTSNVAETIYGTPSIARSLVWLLMIVILLRMVLLKERPLNWGRVFPILIIYIFVLFVSMFHAADFTISRIAFIGILKDALGGVIVILLIQRATSFRQAIWALIIAGIIMGTISVFQTITRTYDNPYLGFGGWEFQTAGEQGRNRVTGPYDNPNAYSQVMIVIFVLALERLWHEKRSLLRIFSGWAVIVSGLTIVFTYSRGGAITVIASLGFLFIQNRPRILPVLLTVIIGLILVQFLPADYMEHVSSLKVLIPIKNEDQVVHPYFRGRQSENTAAWRMFLDNPILGVGLGNFDVQYQNYSRQIGLDIRRDARSPASLYLEILSEQGLVGVIPFILLIYTVFIGLISAKLQFDHAGMLDQSNLTMALFAGFAGYMIAATVKNSAYFNVYWILVGIALSAAQVALFNSREKSELAGSTDVS